MVGKGIRDSMSSFMIKDLSLPCKGVDKNGCK